MKNELKENIQEICRKFVKENSFDYNEFDNNVLEILDKIKESEYYDSENNYEIKNFIDKTLIHEYGRYNELSKLSKELNNIEKSTIDKIVWDKLYKEFEMLFKVDKDKEGIIKQFHNEELISGIIEEACPKKEEQQIAEQIYYKVLDEFIGNHFFAIENSKEENKKEQEYYEEKQRLKNTRGIRLYFWSKLLNDITSRNRKK